MIMKEMKDQIIRTTSSSEKIIGTMPLSKLSKKSKAEVPRRLPRRLSLPAPPAETIGLGLITTRCVPVRLLAGP